MLVQDSLRQKREIEINPHCFPLAVRRRPDGLRPEKALRFFHFFRILPGLPRHNARAARGRQTKFPQQPQHLLQGLVGDGEKRVYDSEIPIMEKLRRNG